MPFEQTATEIDRQFASKDNKREKRKTLPVKRQHVHNLGPMRFFQKYDNHYEKVQFIDEIFVFDRIDAINVDAFEMRIDIARFYM